MPNCKDPTTSHLTTPQSQTNSSFVFNSYDTPKHDECKSSLQPQTKIVTPRIVKPYTAPLDQSKKFKLFKVLAQHPGLLP